MHRLNVLQKEPVCAQSSYTPPASRNTHVTLAIAHSWDHKSDSHGGHTSLITPCFHAYIRAPFMAIYDCLTWIQARDSAMVTNGKGFHDSTPHNTPSTSFTTALCTLAVPFLSHHGQI